MKLAFIFIFTTLILSHTALAATTSENIKPWPSTTIPYIIENDIPTKIQRDIRKAIERINSLQIVKLQDKSKIKFDSASIVFTYKKRACASSLGWSDGPSSLVKVSEDCKYGNILHEILHSLGMAHEQLNPLRTFSINFDNISTGIEEQFEETHAIALTAHDPDSIMHYNSLGFTVCDDVADPKWSSLPKERLPNNSCHNSNWKQIKPEKNNGIDCSLECAVFLDSENKLIGGQRDDLSKLDIEGLRKLYNQI